MKRLSIIIGVSLFFFAKVNGQYSYSLTNNLDSEQPLPKIISPLTIGDKVPSIILNSVLNYKKEKINLLSEFTGKYVILDFWGSFCAPCIAKFPELQTLQKKFKDDLVILTIGVDGPGIGTITKFVNERKNTKRALTLPTAIENPTTSDFFKYFPYSNLPHEVWIDRTGAIIAITGAEAVNLENIKKIIAGDKLPFEEKKIRKNVAFEKSFLVNSPESSNSRRVFGSAFSGYNDTLFTYNPISLYDTAVFHLQVLNQTEHQFYLRAYSNLVPWLKGNAARKKILNAQTELPIFYDEKPENIKMNNWELDKFRIEKVFCYELILPKQFSKKSIYSKMVNDIDNFFESTSTISERKIKCWVLTRLRSFAKPDIAFQAVDNVTTDDSLIYYNAVSVDYFVDQMNAIYKRSPLILNKTNITDSIKLSIPLSGDFYTVKKHLNSLSLDLLEMDVLIPVIIVGRIK